MTSLPGFLKDFRALPLAIIDTMKNILACFTRLYCRRMSTTHRPRRKQPQLLRTKDEHFKEGGLFSQEGGCGRTPQGTGRGVEVWKPTRRPPSLTTHQSCFHKHSSLTMSHKYLIFHAMPEILLTAREHKKIICSGFLTPLTLNLVFCMQVFACFCPLKSLNSTHYF